MQAAILFYILRNPKALLFNSYWFYQKSYFL